MERTVERNLSSSICSTSLRRASNWQSNIRKYRWNDLPPKPQMTILSYFGSCPNPVFLTIFQNFLQLISYSRFYSSL